MTTDLKQKPLSECGNEIIIDEKENYRVHIDSGEYQVIVVGFEHNKAGAKFRHPNIVRSVKTIHEFKHYRKAGSKFWTSKAGVSHYLIIPRNKINIILDKGYSYIPAEINGVKIRFNASGGTDGKGWLDWLGCKSHISVNHKLSDFKKLVAVSQRNTPIEHDLEIKDLEPEREEEWNRLTAKANPKLKEAIAKMIEDGEQPKIKLVSGFSINDGIGISVVRRMKKTKQDSGWTTYGRNGALKNIVGIFDGMRYGVKMTQIDWSKTAKANGVEHG